MLKLGFTCGVFILMLLEWFVEASLSNSAACSRKTFDFPVFLTIILFLKSKKKNQAIYLLMQTFYRISSRKESLKTPVALPPIFSPSFSLCETLVCFPPRVWWRPMRSTPWRWGLRSSSPPMRTGTTAAPGRRGRVKAAARTPPSPNTPSTRHPASRRACR